MLPCALSTGIFLYLKVVATRIHKHTHTHTRTHTHTHTHTHFYKITDTRVPAKPNTASATEDLQNERNCQANWHAQALPYPGPSTQGHSATSCGPVLDACN